MKQIVSRLVQTFQIDKINWSAQILMTKKLLEHYTREEILYAIDYYKRMGKEIYSIAYLAKCMDKPIREMKAMQNITLQDGNSGDRNKRKFRENNEAISRKECFGDLFEKPNQGD